VRLLVDGNNVMGSRPDGWWRDRPAATLRLVARLRCYAAASGLPVEVVFDVAHPDLPAGQRDGVTVWYAVRTGRDAADDRVVELLDAAAEPGEVEVVTSDRGLAIRVRDRAGHVTPAGAFLQRLDDAGC
jgi:predicted RNA-binding protein with PIN domain